MEEYVNIPLPKSESEKLSKDKFAMWAVGSSMSPEIEHGDLTIVDTNMKPKHNDLIIVSYRGELFIKRLINEPTGQLLRSNNPKWADIAVAPDTQIVGVIAWVCKKKYNGNKNVLLNNIGVN